MRIFKAFFFVLILITAISCGRIPEENLLLQEEVMKILPAGKCDAQIFGQVAYGSPRLVALQKKMTEAIQKNAQWFAEYKAQNSLPLPYHPNLGLSPREYNEMILLSKDDRPRLKKTGAEVLEITHEKHSIGFNGMRVLEFFDDVEINFRSNTVTMNENKLKYLSQESSPDTNNIFRSPWKGYSWELLEPANAMEIPKEKYGKKSIRIYKFTVGKLERINRSFIIAKGFQYKDGEVEFEFEAPIIL
jgi:hypothetical protein